MLGRRCINGLQLFCPSRLTWRESNAMGYMATARKLANYFGTAEKKT